MLYEGNVLIRIDDAELSVDFEVSREDIDAHKGTLYIDVVSVHDGSMGKAELLALLNDEVLGQIENKLYKMYERHEI